MHFLYVGYYVNENTFTAIQDRRINNMSVARQKFEYNIIRGFREHLGDNVSFLSYVPTDGKFSIPDSSVVDGATVTHIAIQKRSAVSLLRAYDLFREYILSLGEDKLNGLRVLMYAVIPPFEQVLLSLKKKYGFKIFTVCSEVPELRRYGSTFSSRIKKKILTYYNERFDGYVLFSCAMKEVIRTKNKPCLVMEGIAPEILNLPTTGKKNIVMYAGGLASDNQIPLLIESCQQISELNEVWICGVGQDEERIKDMAKKDSRVKYFGLLPNEQVLLMESKAKLLINFRNPHERLTRYSFPSKILEYIASGSLVLSTRLVGIPAEYYNYILGIDIDDSLSITSLISNCFRISDDEYIEKCSSAQEFISNEKNYYVQSKKIIDFIMQ